MVKSRVEIKHLSIVGLMSPSWVRTQVRTHSDFCWTRGLGLGLWPTGLGLWSNGLGLTRIPDGLGLWSMDSDLDSDSDSGLVDSDSLPDSRVRTHSNTAYNPRPTTSNFISFYQRIFELMGTVVACYKSGQIYRVFDVGVAISWILINSPGSVYSNALGSQLGDLIKINLVAWAQTSWLFTKWKRGKCRNRPIIWQQCYSLANQRQGIRNSCFRCQFWCVEKPFTWKNNGCFYVNLSIKRQVCGHGNWCTRRVLDTHELNKRRGKSLAW